MMSETIQQIIIGISIVGAVAFLIIHYFRGRKKKSCANCPVMKSQKPGKDRSVVR